MSAIATPTKGTQHVPTYCYQCVAGPDLLRVKVEDGVATEIGPNPAAKGIHPADGRPCVRAYGLVQKTYNPYRVLTPMKRTNPKKGRDEDPQFVAISWDEALDTVGEQAARHPRARPARRAGPAARGGQFRPRRHAGQLHGQLPGLPGRLGPIDYSLGSGQGVKCVHSEHLYGEFWHRGFTVCADTPTRSYIVLSFGANVEVTGGVCAVRRHADARVRGVKRVYVEPHLSVTGACSAEWVPIKPKTDAAFMLALIHVLLHEAARAAGHPLPARPHRLALPGRPRRLLPARPASGKPLLWDERSATRRAPRHAGHAAGAGRQLQGAAGRHHLARWRVAEHHDASGRTAFGDDGRRCASIQPEWAPRSATCPRPRSAASRSSSWSTPASARPRWSKADLPLPPGGGDAGQDGQQRLGRLRVLLGPHHAGHAGGRAGSARRHAGHHRALEQAARQPAAQRGAGRRRLHAVQLQPHHRDQWQARPTGRNAHRTLVPHVGNSPWSQALGPTHLAWMFMREAAQTGPSRASPSCGSPTAPTRRSRSGRPTGRRRPSRACPLSWPSPTRQDETNHMADMLLPEATDLESTQLIRCGGTKFVEQAWAHRGVVLRQPAVAPQGEARDFTWIATELARRTGLLERVRRAHQPRRRAAAAVRRGAGTSACPPTRCRTVDEIWDAVCKAATAELSEGKEVQDLAG
jgi:phenylacetyl-CoA:acceptor oxidoreductase